MSLNYFSINHITNRFKYNDVITITLTTTQEIIFTWVC